MHMREFLDFLKHYGIVGLAIAVVIGGKVNALVNSLVNDIITPTILQPALQRMGVDSVAQLSWNGVFYGKFLASSIDFLIVAWLVFFFAKKVLKEEIVAKK